MKLSQIRQAIKEASEQKQSLNDFDNFMLSISQLENHAKERRVIEPNYSKSDLLADIEREMPEIDQRQAAKMADFVFKHLDLSEDISVDMDTAPTAEELDVGEPVKIISGELKGKEGHIDSFNHNKRLVMVDLGNDGLHTFKSSEVAFNAIDEKDQIQDGDYEDMANINNENTMESSPSKVDRIKAIEKEILRIEHNPDYVVGGMKAWSSGAQTFLKPMVQKKLDKLNDELESLLDDEENVTESENPLDVISVDVPLFIRLMEYAREDAKTDMDLHDVAEMATKLSANGKTLGMAEYEEIVGNNGKKKVHEAELKFLTVNVVNESEMRHYIQERMIANDDIIGDTYLPSRSLYGVKMFKETSGESDINDFIDRFVASDINDFIDRFVANDHKKTIRVGEKKTIRVGEKFTTLTLEVYYGIKSMQFNLMPTPKTVKDIVMSGDKINFIRFEDGTRYPRLTPTTFKGRNLDYTLYFTNPEDAHHTLLTSVMSIPDGWEYEIENGAQTASDNVTESSIVKDYTKFKKASK
jgi:transcription antitermination factor NusG